MTFDELLLLIVALAFGLVSSSLAFKFILEAYMEYIQIKTGIRVVTDSMLQDMKEDAEDDN